MYFRFGQPHIAFKLFDRMPLRNDASWNTVISGCARAGLFVKSIELFRSMRGDGFGPNGFVLASILSAFNQCREVIGRGIEFHGFVLKVGILNDVYVATALLHLYGTHGLVYNAERLFDEMPERNVVSWTALMVSYSKNGYPEDAVIAYQQMKRDGVPCNENSFSAVISSCGLLASETIGFQILAHAVVCGSGNDVSVLNAAIALLDSLERVEDAERVFYQMKNRDRITWNSMISLYSHCGMCEESLQCFSDMRHANVRFDATTLSSLISVCASVNCPKFAKGLHAFAVKQGLDASVSVANTLVSMYSLETLEDAESLFHAMVEKDLISWNSMISAYAQCGQLMDALKIFSQLLLGRNVVNHVSFASALGACSSPEALSYGEMVHALMIQFGLQGNLLLGNALITMYSKCNAMRKAELVFQRMPAYDVVTCNALIGGNVENEEQREAMQVFSLMRRVGIRGNYITMVNVLGSCSAPQDLLQFGMPLHAHIISCGFESDEFVKNSLLTMYSKCGDFNSSKFIFDRLAIRTTVSWNVMVASKAHHFHGEDALKLFTEMRYEGVELDQFSLSAGLAASTSLASVEEGQQLHSLIIKFGYEMDLHVRNAAMDMYGKCGNIDDMLKMLPEPSSRSRQTWNIMISVYARHGLFEKAEKTFKQMLQIGPKPDYVTFVSLLAACNHAGLADKGLDYYAYMTSALGIQPRIEHCVCMVDLLGRSGKLIEAEKFVENMPVQPNDLIWRSLLASSRIHKNLELGKKAAQCLLKLDPLDDSAYVLLSNVCATTGRWEDVEKVRTHMKSINLKKRPACSWIKVKNKVSSFGSGDRGHPQAELIYAKLEGMLHMVKELGYVADTSFTLHDIDEEQKEHTLWNHSEKLALAFGLMGVPEGSIIRVFKNLRVCGDCHLVYKLVSKAVGRELVLRDPFRFHHFKDGKCSCLDYW
ncbi:LOW QUALITY PROTEIN: pentatricopeptide repeat-containing protein At3g24000, mitochondrial-like [Dioscorea cayenensis subsp. rotundata]|uniref:LOW QUALITY PROTEIN: pentatricopeptide repeat-containing protein At3g24000, mitochondrial-like n=1 Tax=Dioscorea cayennensis subsp. rotundata TaxID=55577 RepID=A0AB40C856_DIOCR|nr:LOW QUALITY PROTEIN: pentatricopeptide repeat-containing protein At3g24000, mitochondrial-like [Dioscorea cayenensis subsp. rotundata]